jgi:hypothetical protein
VDPPAEIFSKIERHVHPLHSPTEITPLKFFSKFSEKNAENRYRLGILKSLKMAIFGIEIVGIYRFRDPDSPIH